MEDETEMSHAFKRRGLVVHPDEIDEYQIHQFVSAGLNFIGLHPVGGPKANLSMSDAIACHYQDVFQTTLKSARQLGFEVAYEGHALSWLLPRSLFAKHPDWFRMDHSGVRSSDVNLCPSCKEALDYLAGRAGELARLLDTGSNRYFLWMDDTSEGAECLCSDCRHLSPSDQQLKVANAMLGGIRRVNPEAQLAFLAYQATLQAPRSVDPVDGVFLEYAPFRRDFGKPLSDRQCERNVREIAPLRDLISCFGSKDAKVLDYWMDNSLYSNWIKPPRKMDFRPDVMLADLMFYLDLGFEDISSFGCYLGKDYRALWGDPPIREFGRTLSLV